MILKAIFIFIAFFLICNFEICHAQSTNSTGNCTQEAITVIINGKTFKVNFDSCTGTQTSVTNSSSIDGRYVFNVNMITSSETVNIKNDNLGGGGKAGSNNNNNNILFSPKVQSGQYAPSIGNTNRNAPGGGGFDNNNNVVTGKSNGTNSNNSITVNNNNARGSGYGGVGGFGAFGDYGDYIAPNSFYSSLLGGSAPFGGPMGRRGRLNLNNNNMFGNSNPNSNLNSNLNTNGGGSSGSGNTINNNPNRNPFSSDRNLGINDFNAPRSRNSPLNRIVNRFGSNRLNENLRFRQIGK